MFVLVVLILGASLSIPSAIASEDLSPCLKEGCVPDEATALKIAEAIWLPIYGQSIYEKKPFKASLVGGIWHVEGTLEGKYIKGGVPEIDIDEKNGKVLRVSHGK